MSEIKMSEMFDISDFNIINQTEIVDTSRYAYIQHNEVQVKGEIHINHAVRNHDLMVEEIAGLKAALLEIKNTPDVQCDECPSIASAALEKLNQEVGE